MCRRLFPIASCALLFLILAATSGNAGQKTPYKGEVQPIPVESMNVSNDQEEETLSSSSDETLLDESTNGAKTGTVIVKNFSSWYVNIYGDGKLLWRILW
jgi:hypothetical protein